MRYKIYRECWNEKTFNGYVDSPYWRISFDGYEIGLKDDGKIWSIINGVVLPMCYINIALKTIIEECKLNIEISD
jgi:hypothetical protein